MNAQERIMQKVAIRNECWEWTGYIAPSTGYGMVYDEVLKRPNTAHRVMLRVRGVEIPTGHHVDHLCRNRACVNPAHLEVVTSGENFRRSHHRSSVTNRDGVCQRGHAWPDNASKPRADGSRYCQICASDMSRERYASKTRA